MTTNQTQNITWRVTYKPDGAVVHKHGFIGIYDYNAENCEGQGCAWVITKSFGRQISSGFTHKLEDARADSLLEYERLKGSATS